MSAGNRDLIEALEQIEKEKNISKDVLIEAIENSVYQACKNQFGKADNVKVTINKETGEFSVYAEKTISETIEDSMLEISLEEAKRRYPKKKLSIGDIVKVEITPKNFLRISAQKAKQVVVQKIREEERKVLFNRYYDKERDVVVGTVQRFIGNNVSINLGKADAILAENEQIKNERLRINDRVRVYVLEVKDTTKGPRISVSRTHKELVRKLFEEEVAEVHDGTVEIRSIAREAGARTKMAVWSNNPDVDPVGACVGLNGQRVNVIVDELRGEKIDIVEWSEDPAKLIENALSPAKVVSVEVYEDERAARVIVPDYQLSLAIGKEGQNARLAARLTGYKIDIKCESQMNDYYSSGEGYYADDVYDGQYGDNAYYDDGTYAEGAYEGEYYDDGTYTQGYEGEYAEGTYEEGYYQEGDYPVQEGENPTEG